MKPKKQLLYLKAVNIGDERGKYKQCLLCGKEFGLIAKEHQCKRCKRAVCDKCSQNKAIVLKYDVAPKQPHRQCNFCKEECDAMKKFVDQNRILFNTDTISVEWLKSFDMNFDIAQKDYKDAQEEAKTAKDQSEFALMKGQLQNVFSELDECQNYSLREFFALSLKNTDKKSVQLMIERLVGTFLLKYPTVGYSADLIFISYFLLCFSSESVAYTLLTIIYSNVLPSNLYFRSLRIGKYDYATELDIIQTVALQGLKLSTQDIQLLKQFISNRVSRYILPLTLNYFLFETTYFIFSQIFESPKSSYEELMKSLTAAFSLQLKDLKRFQNNFDEGELFILRNVKASQVQGLYFMTKKIQLDLFKSKITREKSIVSRSDSIAQEKIFEEQSFKQKSDDLKSELKKLKEKYDEQRKQNELLENEKNELEVQLIGAKEQLKLKDDEYNTIMEENHSIKLEKMQAAALGQSAMSNANNELQLLKEREENNQLHSQIQKLESQLQDNERKQKLLDQTVAEEQIKSLKQKESNERNMNRINDLESQILKLKQEKELFALGSLSKNQENKSSDSNIQIIQLKNEEISKLSNQFREQQQKSQQLQNELNDLKEQNKKLVLEKESQMSELSLLERNNKELKDKLKHENEKSGEKSAFNVMSVLKDLEDGRNLLEKKNQEILSLKKQIKEFEEENYRLREQVDLTGSQGQQGNQKYNEIEQFENQDNDEITNQIEESLNILSKESDSKKKEIIKILREKITVLEREYIFQVNDSKIKRDQLQPYKEKVDVLSNNLTKLKQENEELKNQVRNQSIQDRSQSTVHYKPLNENDRKYSLQERQNLRNGDPMNQNNTNCTPCRIF